MNKRIRLYLTAILCTLLWGSAIPSIKLGFSYFNIMPDSVADKLFFAGVRFAGAGIFLLLPCFITAKKFSITKKTLSHSLIIGLIQTAGQYFFMYIGLAYTTSVNASVFNSFGTLLYIILAWIIFRDEKITVYKVAGCIIGFAGILINSLATQNMGLLSFKGDGLLIIANICVAAGFLYSKHGVKDADPFLLTGMQMSVGGIVLLITGLIAGGRLPEITLKGCILLVYLIAVSAVAFSLWTLLLREYPSALVGMFNFLTPVFGSVFSYILNTAGILNENSSFTVFTALAILLSAGGIFISSINKQTK